MKAGVAYHLTTTEILKICSPKKDISGPYFVIYIDITDRWAIVALDHKGEHRLGIRWFWDSCGTPQSRGHSIWFIIPESLNNSILSTLGLTQNILDAINDFLNGKIKGEDLKAIALIKK